MNYKKLIATTLMYTSLFSIGLSSIEVSATTELKSFIGKGQDGYIISKYYDESKLNILSKDKLKNLIDETLISTDKKLDKILSEEEYLEIDSNGMKKIKNKNTGESYDIKGLEKKLEKKVLEKHTELIADNTVSNCIITPIGSKTDDMWFYYRVEISNSDIEVGIVDGFISEKEEMIDGETVIRNLKSVESKKQQKLKSVRSVEGEEFFSFYTGEYIVGSATFYGPAIRIIDKEGNIKPFGEDEVVLDVIGEKIITWDFTQDILAIKIYDINDGNPKLLERIEYGQQSLIEIDNSGLVWEYEKGSIYRYENGKKVKKYLVDSDFKYMNVHDENNLVLTSDKNNGKNLIIHDGEAITPYEWKKVDGKYYLYDMNGTKQTGWKEVDGKHYYMDKNGVMQSNKWIGSYYVGSNGAMATNKWVGDYYVDGSGKYVKNKWVGSYYCGSNGKYVKSKWVGDYYVDGSGKYVKNKWVESYYCGSNGKYVKSKWVGDYYVDGSGKYVKNKWAGNYYCGSNGKYVKNKWVKTNNKWYYTGSNGKYLKNTSQKIGNKTYKFDSKGVCLNP